MTDNATAKVQLESVAAMSSELAVAKMAPVVSETLLDMIERLTEKYNGTFERRMMNGGGVRVTLETSSGDRIAGNGSTMDAAVRDLAARLEARTAAFTRLER